MNPHTYSVLPSGRVLSFFSQVSKQFPDVWFQYTTQDGTSSVTMRVPAGTDLDELDRIAMSYGLRPTSL